MSRIKTLTVAAVTLVAIVSVGSLSQAQNSDTKALEQKIDALEKKISTMETRLVNEMRALQRAVAQGGGANPNEAEAEAKFASINRLYRSGDLTKAKAEMTAFMAKYGSTQTAQKAGRLNQELAVIGKEAPANWGIDKWFQGSESDLSGGGTTLVVFWETWCPHCQREVPKLQALHEKFGGQGLKVVGLTKITRSATEDKVSDFIQQSKLTYPVAKEDGSATRHFNVSGVPAAAVVKDGKVIWRGHPANLSEQQLQSWL